jgi:hypothetical protein
MDHIVYLDAKSQELENLLNGQKDIIVRGAAGRKLPYGRVKIGDRLFLTRNDSSIKLYAMCSVKKVFFSEKLSEEDSVNLYDSLSHRIKLTGNAIRRFRGKRYLIIVEVEDVVQIEEKSFDRSSFSNMDDWFPVLDIKDYIID